MCGIAGVVDLDGQRPISPGVVRAMADAITHRGPDEDGYLFQPGLGLASRRLSIVGLADGRQPISNEDGTVHVVFNGEFFDYPEQKAKLEARGHRFATHCDTELLPHMWEEYGEDMFTRLRGQFAFALWDERRRVLILARDRLGICPLYWTEQRTASGSYLLFGSEIKALLRSGMVDPSPDLRGIDHALTFFALPGPITAFQGVQALLPGHYLTVEVGRTSRAPRVTDRAYWAIDFPDRGCEERAANPERLIDTYEGLALQAVERRLRADVPVVSYLSGGVDSSLVLALASHSAGRPLPTFTIQVKAPGLDETSKAAETASHVGAQPNIVACGMEEVLGTYPRLIEAAECPVSDTCCAALLLLAEQVHAKGYKVALTGEGADETLAGYPWFKLHRLLSALDVLPGVKLSTLVRRTAVRAMGAPLFPRAYDQRIEDCVGGYQAWLDLYGLVSLAKLRFYGPRLSGLLGSYVPFEDLDLDRERLKRWHPLNQSLYLGLKIHLPGLLLSIGGDRVAMHSSVETRYPFLDEDVVAFLAGLDPRWKLRGFRDKYLLRQLAERYLPRSVAQRPKAMFRTPWDMFRGGENARFVDQLLTDRAITRTGYFDAQAVRHWRERSAHMRPGSPQRTLIDHGLAGVVSTQLWHHQFIEDLGADVPVFERQAPASRSLA